MILSEAAAKEIGRIIQDQELDVAKVCLRVGVKGGGCSGFSYILDLTESKKETDEIFEQHGIRKGRRYQRSGMGSDDRH